MSVITNMQQLEQELDRMMNDPDYVNRETEFLPFMTRVELDKAISGWEKGLKNEKFDVFHRFECRRIALTNSKKDFQEKLNLWVQTGDEHDYRLAEKAKKRCEKAELKIAEAEQKLRELDTRIRNLPFTTELDNDLIDLYTEFGPDWSLIAAKVERTTVAVKNRFMLLKLKELHRK